MRENLARPHEIGVMSIDDEVISFYLASRFQVLHRNNTCHGMQLHAGLEFSALYPAISGDPEEVSTTGFQVVLSIMNFHSFRGWTDRGSQYGFVGQFTGFGILRENHVTH